MNKPTRLLCSLTLLLAVAGCQSSPVRERLIQPDKLKVPPLPAWIREASQQPQLSMDEWQAILNGQGRPGTRQSPLSRPAPQPMTP
jgi:hypothetical protein